MAKVAVLIGKAWNLRRLLIRNWDSIWIWVLLDRIRILVEQNTDKFYMTISGLIHFDPWTPVLIKEYKIVLASLRRSSDRRSPKWVVFRDSDMLLPFSSTLTFFFVTDLWFFSSTPLDFAWCIVTLFCFLFNTLAIHCNSFSHLISSATLSAYAGHPQ